MGIIIILALYCFGYFLSYTMLRIEHEAEGNPYTYGDRLKNVAISIGSLFTVLFILVFTWIKSIEQSGYWRKPIRPVPPVAHNDKKKEDAK